MKYMIKVEVYYYQNNIRIEGSLQENCNFALSLCMGCIFISYNCIFIVA